MQGGRCPIPAVFVSPSIAFPKLHSDHISWRVLSIPPVWGLAVGGGKTLKSASVSLVHVDLACSNCSGEHGLDLLKAAKLPKDPLI